jgi:hypothetical protein
MTNLGRALPFCLALAALAVSTRANAQDAPGATGATGTPPVGETAAHHGRVGGGTGAGLGVGAAAFVAGMAGPEVVYDFGTWHIAGLLGFDRHDGNGPNPPSVTTFGFGVSGWYHLHVGDASDFSIGGGLGFMNTSVSAGGGGGNATVLEPGAQARVFITQNFALSGRLGLSFVFGDGVGGPGSAIGGLGPHIGLAGQGGQVTSIFGFTYFFR